MTRGDEEKVKSLHIPVESYVTDKLLDKIKVAFKGRLYRAHFSVSGIAKIECNSRNSRGINISFFQRRLVIESVQPTNPCLLYYNLVPFSVPCLCFK